MKFIFLKSEDIIYAALVEPWVLRWPLMLKSVLAQATRPEDIHNQMGWANFARFIFKGIISCTIMEKAEYNCYDSYELVKWASKKRGMGKILLLRVMNQGISIIADRNNISPQAMGSIKQIRDKYSNMFDLDPLDNVDHPLTRDEDDDCQTYNHDGGYEYLERDTNEETGGYYISKLHPKATGEYSNEELLDFAVEQMDAVPIPPDIDYNTIKSDMQKYFSEDYYDISDMTIGVIADFEESITGVFEDIYGRSRAGTIRINEELKMVKLTKRQLKRIIKEEYINLKNRGLISEYDDYEDGEGNYYDEENIPSYDALYYALDGFAETGMPKDYLVDQLQIAFRSAPYDMIVSVVEDWMVEMGVDGL